MEASFDNKTNLLNANIRSSVDNSIIYTITTSHNLWGRSVTILKDANPVFNDSPIVGAIYWKKRLFEVHGHRKSISDIKSKPPGFTALQQQQPQPREQEKKRIRGGQAEKKTVVRKQSGKGGRSITATTPTTTPTPRTTTTKREEVQQQQEDNSVPRCTSWFSSSLVRRPSSALLGYIGLADWWRSVTCTARYWRWAADRSEYELSYQREQWKVFLTNFDEDEKKSGGYDRRVSQHHHRHHHHHRSDSDEKTISAQASRDSRSSSGSSSSPRTLDVDAFSYVASDSLGYQNLAAEKDKIKEEKEDKRTVAAGLRIPYRNHLFTKTKPPVLHLGPAALWKDEVFLILVLIYSETKRQDKTGGGSAAKLLSSLGFGALSS